MEEEQKHYSQAVFWIETDKIKPNPYQPRKEFDEEALQSLADSIRQYGVLQPIVVTREEETKDDGGIQTTYELVSGERRWRAAKMAGIMQIPAIIREQEHTDKMKLELAIIENIQREDLNPIDRARAFAQLASEFNLNHTEISKRVGKSREFVSNSIRLLSLNQEVLEALEQGKITEGHTRPILMLVDKPEEQHTLFREIVDRGLTVREAEQISRRIAKDKVRKKDKVFDQETFALEEQLAEHFGTRVRIEKKDKGGKIMIEFFSPEDLDNIMNIVRARDEIADAATGEGATHEDAREGSEPAAEPETQPEEENEDDDLYSVRNFTV